MAAPVFIANAALIARKAMNAVDFRLTEKFAKVVQFLVVHPTAATSLRGKNPPAIGSQEYIERQAFAFAQARQPHAPQPPKTIPDEVVSLILVEYFDIKSQAVERIKREHALSMGAENLVGDLLERYLASVLEPADWVWCSGAMVRAADFIRPPATRTGLWRLLQIKNRDNSENSSSSRVREGTAIEKWHRTFSRKSGSNWSAFPDESLRQQLSETGFKDYVRDILRVVRTYGN